MKKIHWMFLINLLVLLSSCSKNEYYLTKVDKQMTPYQLHDTIQGTNAQGKECMLVVTDIYSWVDTYGYNDWLVEETQRIILESSYDDFSIGVKVRGRENDCKHRIISVSPFYYEWYLYYNSVGKFIMDTTDNPKRFVYDSVTIGNHVYRDVVNLRATSSMGAEEIYYNKTHGVLQVKKDGKAVFTLQEYIPAR